jgi:hypothetical protein
MTDALQNLLKQLRLSGLLSTLEVRLHEAAASQLSHRDFLELILQDELAVRNERLLGRRVKAAQFREVKALDQFDWSFNRARGFFTMKIVPDERTLHAQEENRLDDHQTEPQSDSAILPIAQ